MLLTVGGSVRVVHARRSPACPARSVCREEEGQRRDGRSRNHQNRQLVLYSLSPLDMLDASVLPLPLDRPSLLGVLELLRPAELVGGVLI